MALLEPKFCILDETDSGLDIDALRIVSEGVNALRAPGPLLPRHHPLPAPAELHRARHRARHVGGPDREVGRQGAGARARGQRLRRLPPDRGRLSMSVITLMRTPAETGAGAGSSRPRRPRLPGRRGIAAREAFATFERDGLPHRRVEEFKYTDLRAAHARGRAPRRDARPPRGQGCAGRGQGPSPASRRSRLTFVNGHLVDGRRRDLGRVAGGRRRSCRSREALAVGSRLARRRLSPVPLGARRTRSISSTPPSWPTAW